MIRLRTAAEGDAPTIAAINVRSWQHAFRGHFPDGFLDALDAREREPFVREVIAESHPHHVIVADAEDTVVGFVMLGPPFDDDLSDGTVELTSLYIEPERIGTGLGRALMMAALEWMRSAGFESAALWAPKEVERTYRFYEAAGWTIDREKTEEIPEGNPLPQVRYRYRFTAN